MIKATGTMFANTNTDSNTITYTQLYQHPCKNKHLGDFKHNTSDSCKPPTHEKGQLAEFIVRSRKG